MKVLVIQQKMIGDVLASTVICEAVKNLLPKCTLHYMIHPNTLAVVENNPYVDKIILFDPKKNKGLSALIGFGNKLKINKYDAIIDAYGKWESIIPAYFAGVKIRIGYQKWYTSFFYTKTVEPKKNIFGSAIHHRLQLAEALTGGFTPIDFPKIYLLEEEIAAARKTIAETLQPNVPIFMISVLGSSDNKSLPPMHMASTLDMIASSGNVQMLFNFMPDQQPEAQAIFEQCQPATQQKIVFGFYMKGLRPFLAVLSQCDALIGNEGGAVNMAKALGIPTFTIFSPWVGKSSWDMLADDNKHISVHLNDYFPEIYGDVHPKKFQKQAMQLYKKLAPELFRSQLERFVGKFIS